MKWQKLEDLNERAIHCGAIIRCPAKYPYEQVVDFIVCNLLEDARGMSLVVASGYKSGLVLVSLPTESKFSEGSAISAQWLQ